MRPFSLNIKGRLMNFDKPQVMGILNLTPDSFHAPSRVDGTDAVRRRVEEMVAAGADIIDVGACSTRPGAPLCDESTEMERLCRGLEAVRPEEWDVLWSVDTFRSRVARVAVERYGVHIVNDVSGGEMDADMFTTVAALRVPYVLTHPGGHFEDSPHTVAEKGESVIGEVIGFLSKRLKDLEMLGVADVIVDPGIGFAKDATENFSLIRNIPLIGEMLNTPVLIGLSRKRVVTETLGCSAADALNGTTVLNTVAVLLGASLLRVHDVGEACETVKLVDAVKVENMTNIS